MKFIDNIDDFADRLEESLKSMSREEYRRFFIDNDLITLDQSKRHSGSLLEKHMTSVVIGYLTSWNSVSIPLSEIHPKSKSRRSPIGLMSKISSKIYKGGVESIILPSVLNTPNSNKSNRLMHSSV